MTVIHAFFMALGMFTALPLPYRPWNEKARGLMTICLPLVGAVVGLLWAALAALGRLILPPTLAAALLAVLPMVLTGFIHVDGYMDTSDAVLSWRPIEKRLEILKDVHVGAFAVVAVVLLALLQFAAAQDALKCSLRPLIFIPIASRCMSAFCVTALKPIGHSQYASIQKQAATPVTALVMLGLAFAFCMLWCGAQTGIVLAAVVLGYLVSICITRHMLGGVSGDLAGHALCIGELCGLIALSCIGG